MTLLLLPTVSINDIMATTNVLIIMATAVTVTTATVTSAKSNFCAQHYSG